MRNSCGEVVVGHGNKHSDIHKLTSTSPLCVTLHFIPIIRTAKVTQALEETMTEPKPISDPVAAKVPDKNYPWYIEDIDHRITSEVVGPFKIYIHGLLN